MPTLDRLQAAMGGDRFNVVALSIDRGGAEAVKKFYAEIGIQHLAIHVDTSGKVGFALAAAGLPTTLLIDAEGRELGRLIGPAEWGAPGMVAFLKSIGKGSVWRLPRTRRNRYEHIQFSRSASTRTVATVGRQAPFMATGPARADRPGSPRVYAWPRVQLELARRGRCRATASERPSLPGDVRARALHEPHEPLPRRGIIDRPLGSRADHRVAGDAHVMLLLRASARTTTTDER
ncbi:TlpA disulfide reductase family protein [Sinorhizobium meliloti]|uniref:TlpA disulfide reductase family protein n=1 Tax=Rhizobium meliloti TaxID=382 RepID=UPI002D78EED7|nr:TlpA disulfide reductase family protein [Sinorhizobium meliloti]